MSLASMMVPATCVHVSAIDGNGTEMAYAEIVSRVGITERDIGKAVVQAIHRLFPAFEVEALNGLTVLVRFSQST